MRANPYTPGAGFMPAYLAGREKLIADAESDLVNIQSRYPQRSVIYHGLRGVGKTVLLNRIEEAADNRDILYVHIEATEAGKTKEARTRSFTGKLINALNKFIYEISTKEKARDLVKKCAALLKSFSLTYNTEDNSVSLEIGQDTELSMIGGDYADDLTEIMVQLGKSALRSDDTICIFIDEVQYLSEDELGGLIAAIHRCNQLRLPVMVFCAGLPKILKTAGEAYSYSERLFRFEVVDVLDSMDAEKAIQRPALDLNVEYDADAVQKIVEVTGGYPYFIQQFCNVIWQKIPDAQFQIRLNDVVSAEKAFFDNLDVGFFAVRYDRCTHLEKSFMTAMVKCDKLPCTISNVARIMKREVKSISPLRGQLINKGMIYPTAHGEIDFTVPQFDNFIKRVNPDLKI